MTTGVVAVAGALRKACQPFAPEPGIAEQLNHQLNAVPGVVDGAFFMPDEPDAGGDKVTRLMAFVVAPGLSSAALLAGLRERIDTIFLPRPIVLLDLLPRNSTGKLPRESLQALLQIVQRLWSLSHPGALRALAREHQRKGAAHAQ